MCTPLHRVKSLRVIYVISQYFSVPVRNKAAPRLCILSILILCYGVRLLWIMCGNIYCSFYFIIHSICRDDIQIAFFSLSNFVRPLTRICTRKILKNFNFGLYLSICAPHSFLTSLFCYLFITGKMHYCEANLITDRIVLDCIVIHYYKPNLYGQCCSYLFFFLVSY